MARYHVDVRTLGINIHVCIDWMCHSKGRILDVVSIFYRWHIICHLFVAELDETGYKKQE